MLPPDLTKVSLWYHVVSGGGSPRTSTSYLTGLPALTIIGLRFVLSILGLTIKVYIDFNYELKCIKNKSTLKYFVIEILTRFMLADLHFRRI